MIKAWDTFYPDVLPYIVGLGIPNPTVDRHLMRAAQKMFDITKAWRIQLDQIPLVAGVTSYEIELEAQTEIVRIEAASLDAQPLAVWRADSNIPGRCVSTHDGREAQLSWTPTGSMALVLTVSARPSDTATGISDTMAARYSDVIAKGAIASLKQSPSDKAEFAAECDAIAARVWRGHSSARPRARAMFM